MLSDINLPTMDGLEFLKAVKTNAGWQNIPVMMVTNNGSQNKALQALKLGAAGYVKKPFTLDQTKSQNGVG